MKAILFTHVGVNETQANKLAGQTDEREKFIDAKTEFFHSCFLCRSISIVYIYVDVAIRLLKIPSTKEGDFFVDATGLRLEQIVFDCLDEAEKQARIMLGRRRSNTRIKLVGISALAELFNSLKMIDPTLLHRIAGSFGSFTYDSPKFVEAVIRISRGIEAALAMQPIIRIDADVLPNETAIEAIVGEAVDNYERIEKYFFFSGTYRGQKRPDQINDHAVRTHWLNNPKGIGAFLEDLGTVGAIQLQLNTAQRSPQVISGAGLVMSLSCILELPPFIIPNLVMWVDDHLKRRLHERVGHINPKQTERIPFAKLVQDRGIPDNRDRLWAEEVYFERLLRGCLMHDLIDGGGDGGPLSTYVELAVKRLIRRSQPGSKEKLHGNEYRKGKLVNEFSQRAFMYCDTVLKLWDKSQSRYYDDLLSRWASNPVHRIDGVRGNLVLPKLIDSVAEDAYIYLVLVAEWSDYVNAIMRLTKVMAPWLYE